MRRSDTYELLTDPDLPLDAGFRRVSYAVFRTDADFGRVIAARFPAASLLAVGDLLQSKLGLSDEVMAELVRPAAGDVPLFCLSEAGLGLICKRYDASVGLGLYLHIHCRPDAGARLLTAGVLGDPSGLAFRITRRIRELGGPPKAEDAASYAALVDAWRAVQTDREGLFSAGEDEYDVVMQTPGRLSEAIERLADFAGCAVDCRVAGMDYHTPVAFYRPLSLDALLLCLLTEIRTHAATRSAEIELRALDDPYGRGGKRLGLAATYVVDALHITGRMRQEITAARQYLSDMAEQSGLDVYFPPLLLPEHRGPGKRKPSEFLLTQTVLFEWMQDPTRLPSGDLKTRPGFDLPEDRGL